jgi:hypothetical protein
MKNRLDIINEFENRSPAAKTKVIRHIKRMFKLEGLMHPSDDKIYNEIVNSYTTWKNNK